MRGTRWAYWTVVAVSAILAAPALACGESLFRVGKGLNYQEYTAPLPGNILVVANTESERAFIDRLAAAGHHIRIVATPDEIAGALSNGSFDIVLARFSQHETVERQMAASSATYLPVVQKGSDEARQARAHYAVTLASDDSVKHFLKAIHRTLKQQHHA